MQDIFDNVLARLRSRVTSLEQTDEWLFTAVNTMKAIVDNCRREDVGIVLKAAEFSDTASIQQLYDTIQGMYGREGFSFRNDPRYYYLSSIVARFPQTELTEDDCRKIREYFGSDRFLLYEI